MTEHRQHPRREIPNAPKAERRGFAHKHHGVVVEDPYAWLEDPNYPTVEDADILSYLSQENDYFQAFLAPHCALVSELFEELKQRKPETDAGVPYLKNGYRYQWRFDQGAHYRCWYRQAEHAQPDDPWEVLLDEQALAETTLQLLRKQLPQPLPNTFVLERMQRQTLNVYAQLLDAE